MSAELYGRVEKPHILYTQIRIRQNQFRLINVKPAVAHEEDVICTLRLAAEGEKYDALSYAWGPGDAVRAITINGMRMMIRANLDAFLRHYRHETDVKTVWIDALCINQGDIAEKNMHVPYMHLVYMRCCRLWIWLGEASADSDLAIGVLKMLTYDHVYAKPPYLGPTKLAAIGSLLARSWWSRAWIVQELVYGLRVKHRMIMCGKSTLEWVCLVLAAARMKAYRGDLREHFPLLDRILELDALRDNVGNRMYYSYSPAYALHLVSRYRRFAATDPRDKVYALSKIAELSRNTCNPPPKPDYGAPVEVVYRDFALWAVRSGHGLQVLRHCNSHARPMPSWVPDWSVSEVSLPLPLANPNSFYDVPWWAEPVVRKDRTPSFSYPQRAYCSNLEEHSAARNARIRRLQLDANGGGMVYSIDELPPNISFLQVMPEAILSLVQEVLAECQIPFFVKDTTRCDPEDEARGETYDPVIEGERITEQDTKHQIVTELREWKAPYRATVDGDMDIQYDEALGALTTRGILFDSVDVVESPFMIDVDSDFDATTQFMVQVGRCKALAFKHLVETIPYTTERAVHEAFWMTLLVGQADKVHTFWTEEGINERSKPSLMRFEEWLPELPSSWHPSSPEATFTTSGLLRALWLRDFLLQIDENLVGGDTWGPDGVSRMCDGGSQASFLRPKSWSVEKFESMNQRFANLAKLWNEQPYDLYHRPFDLLNTVPDPYWHIRRTHDPRALELAKNFSWTPMVGFPKTSRTPSLERRQAIRDEIQKIVQNTVHVVPWGTLAPGIEKYTLGRTFFITRKGYFGLGPKTLCHDDRVAVLSGSPVPFILRKMQVESRQGWQIIGEAYVHGIMDGEVIDQWSKGMVEIRPLRIL